MSEEMMVADKAGMLVGTTDEGAVEVIGWVMAGDEYDLREGETLVTHHKTAEKLGVGDVFKEMKAENAPVKAKKAKNEKVEGEVTERKPRGPRVERVGAYTINKPELLEGDPCERTDLCNLIKQCTTVEQFKESAPKTFKHSGRDGVMKELSVAGFLGYLFKRDIIVSA
jgi:hypothetical protein